MEAMYKKMSLKLLWLSLATCMNSVMTLLVLVLLGKLFYIAELETVNKKTSLQIISARKVLNCCD